MTSLISDLKFWQGNENLVNYSQEINELENQLQLLREKKKQLENHAQQLSSAESAAESALSQLKTAVMTVKAIDPTQVVVLKTAVNAILSGDDELPPLLEKGDTQTILPSEERVVRSDVVEGEESPPVGNDESKVIEVEPLVDLSAEELKEKYTATQLKLLLKALNLKPVSKKKDDLASALAEKGVTLAYLEALLN